MNSKYPNIEKWLGLRVEMVPGLDPGLIHYVVYAKELELALEKSQRLYGVQSKDCPVWVAKPFRDSNYEALLIGMREIQRDTAEGLLRELADAVDREGVVIEYRATKPPKDTPSIISRARKFLESKGEK